MTIATRRQLRADQMANAQTATTSINELLLDIYLRLEKDSQQLVEVNRYITNNITNIIGGTESPGWRWDATDVITAQTTNGATWVPMITVPVPVNKSVQFLATVIGTERPPFGGPAVCTSVSARAAYTNDSVFGLLAVGTGFVWSATSGGTSSTRWTITGSSVAFEVRGDAGFTINWRGTLGALWNPA